ncbi:MAG: NAD-glutamate dehydrogenase domain-containing protein [Novosphingobium sp.]
MATSLATKTGKTLAAALADRLEASLLGTEPGFSPDQLNAAAHFLLGAAVVRQPGEPVIVVDSVSGPVGARMTRIAAINDDMPFLVDSMAAAVVAQGLAIDRLVHPIVSVRRDVDGTLVGAFPDDGDGGLPDESMIYIETERVDASSRVRLRAALVATLNDVRAAVGDWPKLRAAMSADAEALAAHGAVFHESAELLRWFEGGSLMQLGHVLRRRDGSHGEAAGICRTSARTLLSDASYARAFAWFDAAHARKAQGGGLLIVKSNVISQVHRRVPLDLFIGPVIEKAKIVALSVHAGIWTSAALGAPPARVPVLRQGLDAIMERLELDPQGHDGKALVHALTALPHDVLISFDGRELERVATSMMSLVDRPRPQLVLVRSRLERHLFAFVWLPRDALSTAIRLEIEAMIAQAAQATVLDWSLTVDGPLATIQLVLDNPEGIPPVDEAALAASILSLVRGWAEAVETELAKGDKPGRATAITARYAEAFPLAYRTTYGPAEAATDIRRLRALDDGLTGGASAGARDARLHCLGECAPGQLWLKLYQRHGSLPLSDAVPMLENFGFRVVGETPTLLEDGKLGAIHDFMLELPAGLGSDDLLARASQIEPAIAAVLNGAAEDDTFNRLLTGACLAARDVNLLRAMFRYLRQTGMSYTSGTVVDAFLGAPAVTHGLMKLFLARHDPAHDGDREKDASRALNAISNGLSTVSAINDDRLLRRYQALVEAILRTNAFTPAKPGEPEVALAFKIDSAAVPQLPKPVPWREIFVYSRRVEGIHLRAGPIARGGLRWSDRRDDFRTEVLGLMKAQRVKNAVIVPTGAKGGFYPKSLPDPARDRDGWLAEGREAYELFVGTLLSLTDNIVAGKVVHPKAMVIRDGDDPYFVVAADKGTASFSDIANAIADSRDFWLDDAFASGGSKGYDHKAMGITAKGAWLSVQRHFLEMGVDVQRDPVRVVGCGDMSGDVFGNGMLLSKSLRLVAAFDHRHIFIDPDPDPAKSWKERKRLFTLPRSSWDDYDKALISKGGGVFPRSQKQIALSPQARAVLDIAADSVDPETLISAILRSPADLLWFGGIGTYLKAASENNAAVGDPANDALRVDGGEVRAKVIGEGANLGCTQAGRIEYALVGAAGAGGRINTDFIDNSAGVDCSDHEVNIKIALASAKRAGRLTEEARVKLLGEMTEEVAALVLEDNRLQALVLSIAQAPGAGAVPSYLRLIEQLEQSGQIDRRGDGLADTAALTRRGLDGAGLTRPEIAVVLSSTKLALKASLSRDPLPDDPMFTAELLAAFPAAMQRKYKEDILAHRLRREIVANKLANRILNRLGLIHPLEVIEEESAGASRVICAFVAAERLFEMGRIWSAIEDAQMPEPVRLVMFERAAAALRPHIADLLRAGAGRIPPSQLVSDLASGVAELGQVAADLLGQESQQMRAELTAAGAPPRAVALLADLFDLDGAIGIARLARDTGIDAVELARASIEIGVRLGLDWAQGKAARMAPRDPWERLLVAGLARDYQDMRLQFLQRLLAGDGKDPRAVAARWAETQAASVAAYRGIIARAQAAAVVSPAMLAQLASQARAILAR